MTGRVRQRNPKPLAEQRKLGAVRITFKTVSLTGQLGHGRPALAKRFDPFVHGLQHRQMQI